MLFILSVLASWMAGSAFTGEPPIRAEDCEVLKHPEVVSTANLDPRCLQIGSVSVDKTANEVDDYIPVSSGTPVTVTVPLQVSLAGGGGQQSLAGIPKNPLD